METKSKKSNKPGTKIPPLKGDAPTPDAASEDRIESGYYYDDAHGYQDYKPQEEPEEEAPSDPD